MTLDENVKKYLYSTAYTVVFGLLLATVLIAIPTQVISFFQGEKSFLSMLQNILIIPFVAILAGIALAGIPAVLTGVAMGFLNRFPLPVFLLTTIIFGVALEYVYCYLLHIRANYIPFILMTTAITLCLICLGWRLWLSPKIEYR